MNFPHLVKKLVDSISGCWQNFVYWLRWLSGKASFDATADWQYARQSSAFPAAGSLPLFCKPGPDEFSPNTLVLRHDRGDIDGLRPIDASAGIPAETTWTPA